MWHLAKTWLLRRRIAKLEAIHADLKVREDELDALNAEISLRQTELLLVAIGLVAVIWAKLESALDGINHVAFHLAGGQAIEREVPAESLRRKLEFMRKAHKKLEPLKPLQGEADKLIDRVHDLKQRRHEIIHGAATALPAGGLIELLVSKRDKRHPQGVRLEPKTVSTDELHDLFSQTLGLVEFAGKHFQSVLVAVGGETGEDTNNGVAH